MRHSETKTGKNNGELRNVGLQMEIIKKCEWCSQNYVAHSKLSRFCCRECSDKAYKKKRIQEKEKAQEPGFSSAIEPMKDYIRGVGSGFPIVRDYLDERDGSIVIEDNLTSGAVVTISLVKKIANQTIWRYEYEKEF